jgi:hypothetical protein
MRSIVELASTWDRAFRMRVAGAPDSAIRHLAAVAEVELPEDYIDFLSTMGRSTGGLGNADWQIDRVIRRHDELSYDEPTLRASAQRYLFVGFHDTEDGTFEDVHLDLKATPAMVFESSSVTDLAYGCQPNGWYTAASLEEYWVAEAYHQLRLGRFPHTVGLCPLGNQGWSHDHPSHASHLESVAARLGFEPLTAEQLIARCFDREDAGIVAHQAAPGGSPVYYLGATAESALSELLRVLCGELVLKPKQ